jgi:hypothetical protein
MPQALRTFKLPLIQFLLLVAFAHAANPCTLVAEADWLSDGETVIATTSEDTKPRIHLLGIDAAGLARGTTPRLDDGVGCRLCRA